MNAVAIALRREDAKKNTQARVAALLGVGRQTVSDWFCKTRSGSNAGAGNVSIDARVRIPPKSRPLLARLAPGRFEVLR